MLTAAPRDRLLRTLADAPLAALVGHAGAGKTVALHAALSDHDGAVVHRSAAELHAAGLNRDLGAVSGRLRSTTRRVLLAIDDLERTPVTTQAALAEAIAAWPAPHRLLLAGRRLPPQVQAVLDRRDARIVDADELRFDDDELLAVFGGRVARHLDVAELRLLADRCGGWPAVIDRTARRLRTAFAGDDPARGQLVGRLIRDPVDLREELGVLLDAVPGDELRRSVIGLAGLPGFDDVMCRELGLVAGVDGVRDLGLPVEKVGTGLWAVAEPLRALLAPEVPDAAFTRSAARRYLELDHLDEAVQVLAAGGNEDALAATLAQLPPSEVGRIDPARHAAAVGALASTVLAEHPQILVQLADGELVAGRLDDHRDTIGQARRLIDRYPHAAAPAARLEVLAAELSLRVDALDGGESDVEVAALLAEPALPPIARARLLGGLGRASTQAGTATALRRGARLLERSAQLFAQAGAVSRAAMSLAGAATWGNVPLGRYRVALEQLDRALRLTRNHPRARLAVLPHRAFVLIDLGRYAQAESDLTELRCSAYAEDPFGNERSAVLSRWGAARIASQRGDAAATWAACHAVASSEVSVDAPHGAGFQADAAELLARVGCEREAEAFLEQAEARDHGHRAPVAMAAFVVAAHRGDARRLTSSLRRLEDQVTVEPRDRWRVSLLRAHVRHLEGDPEVGALVAAAFEQAAQLGHPDLPMIREPEIARELLALGAAHSASAAELTEHDDVRVEVLGGLRVERAGTTIRPRGRTGELLAFLALHERCATVHRVVDVLWPDSDPPRGRERLRTVLSRVRRSCGALLERRGDTIHLRDHVRVDVEEFLALTDQARSPIVGPQRAAAAAIETYAGAAVPELGDRSWVVAAQRHLEQRLLAMHDLLIETAQADGRLDEAIRLAEAASTIDDTAEHHHLAISRLLAEQGRHRQALQRLEHARAALATHDLAPSDELARLDAYLRRNESFAGEAPAASTADP